MLFQLNTATVSKTVFVLTFFLPMLNTSGALYNPARVLAHNHIGPSLSLKPLTVHLYALPQICPTMKKR